MYHIVVQLIKIIIMKKCTSIIIIGGHSQSAWTQ